MTIVRMSAGAVVLMGLMLMPLAAYSDDIADVLAADARAVALFNAGDADGLSAMMVENFISYGGASPFLIDGREAMLRGFRQGLNFNEFSKVVVSGNRQVRINGSTAVIAGLWEQSWKPIDRPLQSALVNAISTWVKVDGEWQLAMTMERPIPQGSVP